MRTRAFGNGRGFAIHVIIDHPEIDEYRVVVTRVAWI
ncbi:hypothetical protein EDD29_6171 [Actinocorallia herbida]|uniref:Uncharacterized protein n=1 Tax=Actinocorallia herbida TaxID=58109 RepID=A0A3N1D4N0_9ACTN|nr:hypothetical protein EDD29_6171 [Actinocorallia herbida]